MHIVRRVSLALLVLFCLPQLASAQLRREYQPAKPDLDSPGEHLVRLSVNDSVKLAIENNMQIEIQRHEPMIAEQDLAIAWGAYDPIFSGDYNHNASNQVNTNNLNLQPRAEDYRNGGTAGINTLLPYLGATLGITYNGLRSTTNNTFQPYSPEWRSGLNFSASMPLLRNLIWNQPWTQLKSAEVIEQAEDENFRRIVMDTVAVIEANYWQLIADEEQLRVAIKSYETSQALLDQTQTQYEVGVVSKVDVVEAEAGVAQRETEVIRADVSYENSKDRFIDLIFGPLLTGASHFKVDVEAPAPPEELAEIDPDEAIGIAYERRPSIAVLEKEIERREIQVRFAKNQRLPQLDVNANYGTSGLQGATNWPECQAGVFTPCTPDTGGRYAASHREWFDTSNGSFGGKNLTVGAVVSIPLGNIRGRHTVSKTRLELHRALAELRKLRADVVVEVRSDIRLLQSAHLAIQSTERARIAAEEQLRAEKIRLEHGESTPFDVLLREEKLVQAEFEKINAINVFRRAETDLERAQGTLLDQHGIKMTSAGTLRAEFEPERNPIQRMRNWGTDWRPKLPWNR